MKKTGGSSNTTLTLENYNNASAYTGISDFLKIENSKAKLYNYKEYPITPQTLSTIDIGVSDEVDFDEFYVSGGGLDNNTIFLLHFDDDTTNETNYADITANTSIIEYKTGKFGKALWINSGNNSSALSCTDSTTISAIANALSNEYTIEFWFKVVNSSIPITSIFTSGNGGQYNMYIDSSNVFVGSYGSSASINISCPFTTTYNDGDWHHFAFCKSNGTQYLYVDGVALGNSSNSIPTISSRLYLFSDPSYNQGGNCLYIDEYRFSNIARWTEDFTPPTEPYTRPSYNISSLEVN